MNEPITCAKCNGAQFIIQKKGYDIKDGINSFIVAVIILAIGWGLAISIENQNNQIELDVERMSHIHEISGERMPDPIAFEKSPIYLGGTVLILGLSLLAGLKGANDNQRVCISCGNISSLDEKQTPQTISYNFVD